MRHDCYLYDYMGMDKMTARAGDLDVISRSARRVQSAIAAVLGGLAVLLYQYVPQAVNAAPSTHIAIPRALFDIADTVCARNGGYRSVTVERKSDVFTFTCADGLSLRDTVARVK